MRRLGFVIPRGKAMLDFGDDRRSLNPILRAAQLLLLRHREGRANVLLETARASPSMDHAPPFRPR